MRGIISFSPNQLGFIGKVPAKQNSRETSVDCSINSQTFILITRRVALLEQTQDIKGYANTSRNYLITFTHEKFNCFFSIHPSRTSTSNDRIYLEQSTQKKERQADPQKLLQI